MRRPRPRLFYSDQKRLATEHSQLEDQQKSGGISAGAVRVGGPVTITDPAKRELVAKKEDIENKIDALKFEKDLMAPEDYKRQMATLLLESGEDAGVDRQVKTPGS